MNQDEGEAVDSLTNVQEVPTDLCSDSNVRLVYKTVRNPNKLVLELKLTNHSQSRDSVDRLTLLVEPPSNLVVNVGSSCLEVETLSFLETVCWNLGHITVQFDIQHGDMLHETLHEAESSSVFLQ